MAWVYPEWWKLEALTPAQWQGVDTLIEERDPYCRGVLMLGLNAPLAEPARAWLSGAAADSALVAQVAANFAELIDAWPKRTLPLPLRERAGVRG